MQVIAKKERLPWLDNAKMLAMLCVVVGHVAALFDNGFPSFIQGLIVAFNMPLFVLLSGYTSLGGLLRIGTFRNLVDYAEKIFWRMVMPAVCLSALDQAWRGLILARKLWILYGILAFVLWLVGKYKDQRFPYLLSRIIEAVRVLLVGFLLYSSLNLNIYWFLSMLMKLQLLAAMIIVGKWVNVSTGCLIAVVSIMLWGISFLLFDDWSFEMSAYFAIGLVMKQAGFFDRILHLNLWGSVVLFFVGCILCRLFTIDYGFYTNGLNSLIRQGLYHIYPLRIFVAMSISFAIIRWVYAMSHEYTWFSKMGSFTLAFYTIHCLILDDFLKPYIHFDNPANYMWIFGIMATIALTVVTYIIIRVSERWIVSRRLVLGILN